MSPLPYNPLGIAVLASSSAGVFLDAIFIGLRLWARKLKKKKLVTSDYFLITAWILAFADLIRRVIGYEWGIGLHTSQILAAHGTKHINGILKLNYSSFFLWIGCATLTKLSILLIYLELFYCVTWFIWAVRITMGIAVISFFVTFGGLMMLCKPFEANWNPMLPGAECKMSQGDGFMFSGGVNLALDVILVFLPMPLVWTLNISKLKKVAVSAMFGLGFLILFVVAFRFKIIPTRDMHDVIHDGELPGILSSLELYLGMISACLPLLSPAVVKMRSVVAESRAFGYIASLEEQGGDGSHERLARHYADSKRSDEEIMVGGGFDIKIWPGEKGYGSGDKVEASK
ncbi:hypothetical protein K469DRAFT_730364 [Zopfia rhizophila CBS 207.26]|uniref:Rhodopsin domain-containing protein n=1 Tax=Zopfia rhizophila CBS 207.26 TaxID=1314779 RepID=A0A6A6DKT0_9PEZI|nr:hypothetical protein K469DRAFT_730364 [Zopfia rhizophila CBS 207.26]